MTAAAAGCFSILLSCRVLGNIPHGLDAYTYLFQAQVFASGRWTAPATDLPRVFNGQLVVQKDGRRFGIYPPGWPALLAPFVRAGIPQLAGALLAAGFVLLIWRLARLLWPGDWRIAGWAAALSLLSPFFMFMSAGGLSHLPCAVGVAAATVAALDALVARTRKRIVVSGLLTGAGAGFAVLTRPYSGLLGLAAATVICVTAVPRRPRRWLAVALWSLPTGLLCAALFLFYNTRTSGSATVLGYSVYSSDFGFLGPRTGMGIWQNLRSNAPQMWSAVNSEVRAGFLPDLWLIAPALFFLASDPRVWALLIGCLIQFIGYAIYFYFDLYFGPRTLFEGMVWLFPLSAAGIVSLLQWAEGGGLSRVLAVMVRLLIALDFGWTLVVGYPWLVGYYSDNYAGDFPRLRQAVLGLNLSDAVVFVRGPFINSLYNLNDIDLAQSSVLVGRLMTREEFRAARRVYPRQQEWLLEYRVRVVQGRNKYADRFELTTVKMEQLDPVRAEEQLFGQSK